MIATIAVGVLGAGAVAGHRSGATAGPVPGAPLWRFTAPSGPAIPGSSSPPSKSPGG